MSSATAIFSPCVGVCSLDARGQCVGCLRTVSEIADWSSMTEGQRRHCMEVLLTERALLAEAS